MFYNYSEGDYVDNQTYSSYFNIDPEFSPAINAEVFKADREKWKKYYPHESFRKFLKTMIGVLGRKQALSVWVEGVYGTGKSYSILTMKKLIDSDSTEVKEYFSKFNLDMDLYNQLENLKQGGKIITVHRTGSSTINDDYDLCIAIQDSIEWALTDAGIENQDSHSWRDAAIEYLSDEENRRSFNIYAQGSYRDTFAGKNAEEILEELRTVNDDTLHPLMRRLMEFRRIQDIFSLSIEQLASWITEVIKNNGLKGIVFFWDEFTEYFKKNTRSLTGFQQLCELSQTVPFYFVIVTHLSSGIFPEGDQDFKKIDGRFVSPHSMISLPDGIAFELLANALEKNTADQNIVQEWKEIVQEQTMRTENSRKKVTHVVKGLKSEDLSNILPIQPYAALVLKQIASNFNSNQRSMFDFIQGNKDLDGKSFQWFINNVGPYDDNPLLTVNFLWDYFYEKNRNGLTPDVRNILDYYLRCSKYNLEPEESDVLKTTLLLQAISYHLAGTVDIFVPSERNISLSFEGTNLEEDSQRILERLVRNKILFKKPIGNNQEMYNSIATEIDNDEIDKIREGIDKRSTNTLVEESFDGTDAVKNFISLSGATKLRYELIHVSHTNIDQKVRETCAKLQQYQGKIITFICYSKDESEMRALEQKITRVIEDDGQQTRDFVFINCLTPFGLDNFHQYRDASAQFSYLSPKDRTLAEQFLMNAKECLKDWKKRLQEGQFIAYSPGDSKGRAITNIGVLDETLNAINRRRYERGLESNFKIADTLYDNWNNLQKGAQCGMQERTSGVFKISNATLSLENALDGAMGVQNYWKKNPSLYISKVKIDVESLIEKEFEQNGRICIREIYGLLKNAPYGFMSCNLTAFILGFLLKEYKDGNYSYTDGTVTSVLNEDRLKTMIEEIIKLQNANNPRYLDKYIVALTDEEKTFINASSTVFKIEQQYQDSIEQVRSQIRSKLKKLSFPAWVLNFDLDSYELKNPQKDLTNLIDLYCGIANNDNLPGAKSDAEVAQAIGKMICEAPDLVEDLKLLFSSDNCMKGMRRYVQIYRDGELAKLSNEVNDNEHYLTTLHDKFSVDAAKWVWNKDTANSMIDDTILEYQIILKSKEFGIRTSSYENCISEWINKCDYIRISFLALDSQLKETKLLKSLYNLERTRSFNDQNKKSFYGELCQDGAAFQQFYSNQMPYFKKIASYYIEELNESDVEKIFTRIPCKCFALDKQAYMSKISEIVNTFRSNQLSEALKNIWKEKSATETPIQWSEKYTLPISYMVKDEDYTDAQECFETIRTRNTDEIQIRKAIKFLSNAEFVDDLRNPSKIDQIFRERIIGDYSALLTDTESVRQYLLKHIVANPYYWNGMKEINERVKKKAEAEYHEVGVTKALEKIDNMTPDDLRKYLRQRIKDDMSFGLQIIRNE